MKRLVYPALFILVQACLTGCISSQVLETKLQQIEKEHNVIVKVDNPLSRCCLFGDICGLLDRIDENLQKCPVYFKENLGPIIIEESFTDNLEVYPAGVFLRSYVYIEEKTQHFPMHIKNYSLLEKILFFAPNDEEIFLHEATHSFEFNVQAKSNKEWASFYKQFNGAQTKPYNNIIPAIVFFAVPPAGYLRPATMPSLYGACNHLEDSAKTHCYLRRHNGNVEFLKEKDPTLYKKCKIVEKFTEGGFSSKAQGVVKK